jgi:transposase
MITKSKARKKVAKPAQSFESLYKLNREDIEKKYKKILPLLNEKQKRITVANDVMTLGLRVTTASRLTGLTRVTIYKGIAEIKAGKINEGRIRRKGGGRKKLSESNPELVKELESLIEPHTIGDPMSPLRWTSKSLRQLSAALLEKGINVSHRVVGTILISLKYSLQANSKRLHGKDNPDRNEQFEYINKQVTEFLSAKNPVISVDTKKKELVGNYKNAGKELSPKGKPVLVKDHDFGDTKAIPYGVYDIGDNTGYVNVGINHDTGEFAVESIRQWWNQMGCNTYKNATQLLICADAGGSNGYRLRLWKYELQKLANEIGLNIQVCHFPPGTSKWNKIEHRLFSFITKNWRGKPLVDYEVILNLISATKTKKGLTVQARLDNNHYPKKIKVTDAEFKSINLKPHSFHGEWNYNVNKL